MTTVAELLRCNPLRPRMTGRQGVTRRAGYGPARPLQASRSLRHRHATGLRPLWTPDPLRTPTDTAKGQARALFQNEF